jgi:hypothetical protein
MHRITALFLTLTLAFPLQAQKSISGTILDATQQTPVEFAHVFFLSQQHIGAITDEAGDFTISVPEYLAQDTLVISRIGYQPHLIPLLSLSPSAADLTVKLTPEAFTLKEAVVVAEGGLRHLLRRVVAKRADNYPREQHRLKAFYREYSTTNSEFSHLAEAFITLQDGSYTRPKVPRVYVQELRRSKDMRHLPPQLTRVRRNEWISNFVFNNSLRTTQFGFLPHLRFAGFIDSCRFTYLGATVMESDTLIRIGYTDPRFKVGAPGEAPYYFIRGELVINKPDLAIVEYIGKFGRQVEDSPFQIARYQKVDGKYYPTYIFQNLSIRYNQSQTAYSFHEMFYFYAVETKKKDFTTLHGQKRIPEEQSLWDIRHSYHPAFWRDHPVVQQFPLPKKQTDAMGRQELEKQFHESARRVEGQ